MDYGQFLMACVDKWSYDQMAYRNTNDLGYDDMADFYDQCHDEMMDNIECWFYIDHDTQKCPNWDHTWDVDPEAWDHASEMVETVKGRCNTCDSKSQVVVACGDKLFRCVDCWDKYVAEIDKELGE